MEQQLRDVAKTAKKRLKKGFWIDLYRKKEEMYEKTTLSQEKELINSFISTQIITEVKREDQNFKNQVYEILREGSILNPIGKLMDKELVSKMDFSQRQRYVFELSKKYGEIKSQFEREEKLKIQVKKFLS